MYFQITFPKPVLDMVGGHETVGDIIRLDFSLDAIAIIVFVS